MKNLTELRAMAADKLIDAASKQPIARFSPILDGKFLAEPIPATYAAGRQAHVPTIIGWNHDERAGIVSKDMTTEKWKAYAAEHYGEQAERFLTAWLPKLGVTSGLREREKPVFDAFDHLKSAKSARADY